MPFTSLPPEIVSTVASHLNADDILSLSKCVPLQITKQVYDHAFHDKTHFSRYDLTMFEQRAQAQLYIVGSVAHAKFTETLPANYEVVKVGAAQLCLRMHSPWKVPAEGIISEVSPRPREVLIIDSQGQAYTPELLPSSTEEAYEVPFSMVKLQGRQIGQRDNFKKGRHSEMEEEAERLSRAKFESEFPRMNRSEIAMYDSGALDINFRPNPLPEPSTSLLEYSHKLFKQPPKPTRFVNISSFADITVALDDTGMQWLWTHENKEGTPICLIDDKTRELITGSVSNIQVSEDVCTCLVRGVGVVFWYIFEEGSYLQMTPRNANGIRNGFPCLDNYCCYETAHMIAGTEAFTVYTVVSNVVIGLEDDGTVGCAAVCKDDIPVETIDAAMKNLNSIGSFIQLVSSDRDFGLVTTDGRAIVVTLHDYASSEMFLTKQLDCGEDVKIMSIAVGDLHVAMLAEDGSVYSDGKEDGMNGCLGLGKMKKVRKMKEVKLFSEMLKTTHPVKMQLPRKAFGVFTTGPYSGILM